MLARAVEAERERRGYGGADNYASMIGRYQNTVILLRYVEFAWQFLPPFIVISPTL